MKNEKLILETLSAVLSVLHILLMRLNGPPTTDEVMGNLTGRLIKQQQAIDKAIREDQ